MPAEVEVYRAGGFQTVETPYAGWSWSFRNEAQHFVDRILRGGEPRSSGRDSLKDMIIMEEIYRSFLEEKSVKLELQ